MLAVGIGPIGPFEGLIILAVVVLIFGVGKLGDVGGALGRSVREFRKAAKDTDEPDALISESTAEPTASDAPAATGATCPKCSAQLGDDKKFCAECGASVQAAVP